MFTSGALAACGGSSSSSSPGVSGDSGLAETAPHTDGSTPTEASSHTEAGLDATQPPGDAGHDVVAPPADAMNPPDTGVTPPATPQQLTAGAQIELIGVTSDDYVIYANGVGQNLYALSLVAGSTPVQIGAGIGQGATISGRVVFATPFPTGAAQTTLTVWSSTSGGPHTTAASGLSSRRIASVDGKSVIFERTNAQGGTDLFGAPVDLSASTVLTSGGGNIGCTLDLFAVSGRIVSRSCGTSAPTVSSWDPATWTGTQLFANAGVTVVSSTSVFSVTTASPYTLASVPLAGGTPLTIASGVTAPTTMSVLSPIVGVTPDGQTVFYFSNNSVYRSPTTNPAPTLTAAATATGIFAFSADGAWFVDGFRTITHVASGMSHTLDPDPSTQETLGEVFTGDLAFVIAGKASSLVAIPVAGGTEAVLSSVTTHWRAAKGTKVVFYETTSNTQQLHVIDPHTPTVDTVIDKNTTGLALTAERTGIVYTTTAGLFFTAVP